MPIRSIRILLTMILITSWNSAALYAQNYSFDARKIALGGSANAGAGNIAFENVPKRFSYSSIVVPLGLIQTLGNLDVYDPDKPDFDYVRIIDYAGNPLHYTFNRSFRPGSADIVADISHGTLSRDLNTYRGIAPRDEYLAEGLLAPSWGHTFRFSKGAGTNYQGIYVGAGPYVALAADLNFDQQLINILGSSQAVTIPQTTFRISNTAHQQTALAVTGGYRAKFSLPGQTGTTGSDNDGVYVSINSSYLRGFRYDAFDTVLRIDTGADGLIMPLPATTPLAVNQLTSTSGNGFALDFGVAAVVKNWEFGFSVEGVGNRIQWNNPKQREFTLSSLTAGIDFTDTRLPVSSSSIRAQLPVRYIGAIGYHWTSWSAMSDLAYGFEKFSLHGGIEYRLARIALRGGSRYSRNTWQPSGGLGIDLSERLSVDVAAFANTANIEMVREPSLAISLRIGPAKK